MSPSEWATVVSPGAIVIGLLLAEWRGAKRRGESDAASDAKRDATDKNLGDGLVELRRGLEEAVKEFKVSNDRNAQHEKDCAEFRGATVTALNALAKSAEVAASVKERLAVHDERLNQIDDAIQWGTQKFEELFRGQASLSKGLAPPARLVDEPSPPSPPRHAPHRRRRGPD